MEIYIKFKFFCEFCFSDVLISDKENHQNICIQNNCSKIEIKKNLQKIQPEEWEKNFSKVIHHTDNLSLYLLKPDSKRLPSLRLQLIALHIHTNIYMYIYTYIYT